MSAGISTGIFMVVPDQTQDLVALAHAHSGLAVTDLRCDPTSEGVSQFVHTHLDDRVGRCLHLYLVRDGTTSVGVCGLAGISGGRVFVAECWIAPQFRRRGFGAHAMRALLQTAFENRNATSMRAHVVATDAGAAHLVARLGFRALEPQARGALVFELTRDAWRTARQEQALASLHPLLAAILQREIQLGNEVREIGGGWPDPDSVFVRLAQPFRTPTDPPPPGVTYTTPNDPHWWLADFSTTNPRHILAC